MISDAINQSPNEIISILGKKILAIQDAQNSEQLSNIFEQLSDIS